MIDKYGLAWIGTQAGLFRFDSHSVVSFNTNSIDPKKLLNGTDVHDIAEDSASNMLWVTTSFGGIQAISTVEERIIFSIPQTIISEWNHCVITSLTVDKESVIIGTEKGVYALDKKELSVKKLFTKSPFNGENDIIVEKVLISPWYYIILCRNQGILILDKVTRSLTAVHTLNDIKNKNDNRFLRFYDIIEISPGKYLISTSDGIKQLKIEKNKSKIDKSPFSFPCNCYNKEIFSLAKDKDGNIWFSTDTDLVKLNIEDASYVIINSGVQDNGEISLNNVYTIYCDNNNLVWLGCQNGVLLLENTLPKANAYSKSTISNTKIGQAYYIFPVSDSLIYVTAENGLYIVNSHNGVITSIEEGKTYDYMFKDPNGLTIVSSRSGLYVLKKELLIPIHKVYPEFKEYTKFRINSAIELNDSCYAFGTENYSGILIWNYKTFNVENFTKVSRDIKLAEDVTNGLFLVKKNIFFVLSDASLMLVDYKSKVARQMILSPENDMKLYFDMCKIGQNYYIACHGKGVFRLNSNFKITKKITSQEGLTCNEVYKLLPYKDSILFVTSNYGLNILNLGNNKISYLFKNDGLHSNIFEETSGCVFGEHILAGGQNGFSVIYPDRVINKSPLVKLYFNKIDLTFRGNISRDTSNIESKRFNIKNNVVQTIVHLSGVNYRNPEHTTFKYKLNEISDDWIDLGTKTSIPLIGIGPGTYHLSVQAFNEDGIGSEIKTLTLRFLPKWYQTLGFKIGIALLVFGIGYSLYRYRIAQIRKQHQIRKDIAGDLHDDIGSTLNSVKVFTHLALEGKNKEEYLHQASENLTQASASLRDMIWVLDDQLDTAGQLCNRLQQFIAPLANAIELQVNFSCTPEAQHYRLHKNEKRNLLLICKEAINNSIKYAGATLLEIKIALHNKKPHIIIQDNGKGFDLNNYQAGNGLKNLQYRAKQIGYKIIVDSQPGKGTCITVSA